MKISSRIAFLLALPGVLVILAVACAPATPTPAVYPPPELKYRLLSSFDSVFWCDPDLYPIERPGQEERSALEQFPSIRNNVAEFTAILRHAGLPYKSDYTNSEKLVIYREHKKLTYAVEMTASANLYNFVLRVEEGQGYRIEGTITPSGEIRVLKKEVSFNTCPICLASDTLIDTPTGLLPVEQLRKGMGVWTFDVAGNRIAAVVLEAVSTPVPASFRVVKIRLDDGRSLAASPAHPTADGRPLGDYRTGDALDGALVVSAELVAYDSAATHDILPSGGTGFYRANGVLLKSTLKIK